MLQTIRTFLELIRFSHTVFALPFALLGAVLAWRGREDGVRWQEAVGIVLCMVCARSTAMAFNRIADRNLDGKNPRTAGRHLPAGLVRVPAVLAFVVVTACGFIASTLLFLPNPWPMYLGVPVLLFLCGYSYAKRFTSLAHFWLGAALMLAPVAAWIAIRGLVDLAVPGVLGVAVGFWVAGFDILYACQDADFDHRAGLHSVPARLGIRGALRVAAACHAVAVLALGALHFLSPHLGSVYLAGVVAVAVLLVYEHWLVRPDDLSRVNRAFFQVNAIISIGMLAIVLVQLAIR